MMHFTDFNSACADVDEMFLKAKPLKIEKWQAVEVEGRPQSQMRELLNFSLSYEIPVWAFDLAGEVRPNLPWAEDHFKERVGGEPLNPPPSNEWWPFAQAGNSEFKKDEVFSHTYPERMWPKWAGETYAEMPLSDSVDWEPHRGIRYDYGDLEDVVVQLKKDPLTRQAYLPIWFPEDTGAVHGERVPCTLGYHFLIRDRTLQITYYIRSCDYMRHFRDDVYMAARLAQWMVDRYNEDAAMYEIIGVGKLYMHIVSFHIFEADVPMLEHRRKQNRLEVSRRLMEKLG